MRFLFLLTIAATMSACSIYESDGRKYLEQHAYQFAGVSAQANLLGCQLQSQSTDWVEQSQTPNARILENDGFELRIEPKANPEYGCEFRFSSAQELVEKTNAAIEYTLARSSDQQI